MKKVLGILAPSFLLASILICNSCCAYQDDEINALINGFYDGLADVVERNMDSPEQCVKEVEDYYTENKQTVEKVQQMVKEGITKTMSAVKDYETIDEEQINKDLEKGAMQSSMVQPEPSKEVERYTKALNAFTKKYPQEGLKISMKAMQFVFGTPPADTPPPDTSVEDAVPEDTPTEDIPIEDIAPEDTPIKGE